MNVFHGRDSSLSSITGSLVDSSGSISTSADGSPGISPISSPYLSPGNNGVVGGAGGFVITAAAMSGAGAGFLGGGAGGASDSPHYHLSNSNNNLYATASSASSLQLPTSQSLSVSNNKITSSNDKLSTSGNTTFVHKLYNMVVDTQSQHLIAWNYTGTSFIVCDISEFSKEVLPKHFKHSNFSSFVRQLNMYGFHKVNKSPRGHKTLAENQIWEFSHSKFIKDRPDLLDEIKRKSIENHNSGSISSNSNYNSDHHAITKRYYSLPYANHVMINSQSNADANHSAVSHHLNSGGSGVDSNSSSSSSSSNNQPFPIYSTADYRQQQHQHEMLTMIQVSQTDMVQKLAQLQENFNLIVNELAETKNTQAKQQQVLENLMNFLTLKHKNDQQQQQQLAQPMVIVETPPPSIFITSHDNTNHTTSTNANTTNHLNQRRNQPPPPPILTDNLSPMVPSSGASQQASPALSAYHTALNTPISPLNSPNPFIMMSDENIHIPSIPTSTSHSHITNESVQHLAFALNNTTISNHHGLYTTQPHHQQQQQQHLVFYHNDSSQGNLIDAAHNNDRMMIDPPNTTSATTATTNTNTLSPMNYKFFMHPQQQES